MPLNGGNFGPSNGSGNTNGMKLTDGDDSIDNTSNGNPMMPFFPFGMNPFAMMAAAAMGGGGMPNGFIPHGGPMPHPTGPMAKPEGFKEQQPFENLLRAALQTGAD
jgi:hypothetical protein